jgi:hypothetical protein
MGHFWNISKHTIACENTTICAISLDTNQTGMWGVLQAGEIISESNFAFKIDSDLVSMLLFFLTLLLI